MEFVSKNNANKNIYSHLFPPNKTTFTPAFTHLHGMINKQEMLLCKKIYPQDPLVLICDVLTVTLIMDTGYSAIKWDFLSPDVPVLKICKSGPEVIELFYCIPAHNVKMPTIKSTRNSILGLSEPKKAEFLDSFILMRI